MEWLMNHSTHSNEISKDSQYLSLPRCPWREIGCTDGKFGDNVIQHFHFFSLMWSLVQSLHLQFALMHFLEKTEETKTSEANHGLLLWVQHSQGYPQFCTSQRDKRSSFRAVSSRMGSPANGWWCSPHVLGLLPISCCSACSCRSRGCCTAVATVLQV